MQLDIRRIEVVDRRVADVLRAKTPAERLDIAFSIWASARAMLLSYIGYLHPDWPRQDVEREVARRLLHGSL
jgi:hypothetical protein